MADLIEEYIRLGLALGRHVNGLVDAYYGPEEWSKDAAVEEPVAAAELADRARRLRADLASDRDLDASRRLWLSAQVRGLHTTARKLAGETVAYLDEIHECYGIRPELVPEETLADAHARLDAALPGSGAVAARYSAWRESHAVQPDKLEGAVRSLAEDLQHRTKLLFGLPDGERIDFEMVTNRPWSGFNYYLGGLHSRVAVNIDLPVLSLTLGHLVAHEAYPGHHTEHCRKEAALVRRRQQVEETIFLVGTPQCLLAEGLADLGLEVVAGPHPESVVAEHLHALDIRYDADMVGEVVDASEVLGAVRGNAAILMHDRGMAPDDAIDYISRWAMTTTVRAAKSVEFLMDPTWRAYVFCYIEGLRRTRAYVGGDPDRFERLITDQIVPDDLVPA